MEKKIYCPFCGNPSIVELRDTSRASLDKPDEAQSIDHEWFNDATSTINEFTQRAEAAEAALRDVMTRVAQNEIIKKIAREREDIHEERDYLTRRAESLQATLNTISNERDELARQLEQARKWARVWKSAAKWRRMGAVITFNE